ENTDGSSDAESSPRGLADLSSLAASGVEAVTCSVTDVTDDASIDQHVVVSATSVVVPEDGLETPSSSPSSSPSPSPSPMEDAVAAVVVDVVEVFDDIEDEMLDDVADALVQLSQERSSQHGPRDNDDE